MRAQRRGDRVAAGLMVLGAAALALACNAGQPAKAGGGDEPKPFAVIELFTSEGCSSCPPADKLLGEFVGEWISSGRRVFALAFHVDYWDRLGWKDPYANDAFTKRQKDYGDRFRLKSIYTPQVVVNGHEEVVGSDGDAVRAKVDAALERPARAAIEVVANRSGETVIVEYALRLRSGGRAPEDEVVNVALVERDLVSEVKAGENIGRTLKHANVVRVFTTVRPGEGGKGRVELKVPQGVQLAHSSVIVYAQDDGTRQVLGAESASITDAPKPEPGQPTR